jgi:hypothetical protein
VIPAINIATKSIKSTYLYPKRQHSRFWQGHRERNSRYR